MVSFTRITWIRSVCLEYLVIRNWQQMVSGDLQSKHFPVSLQGVLMSNPKAQQYFDFWAKMAEGSFQVTKAFLERL